MNKVIDGQDFICVPVPGLAQITSSDDLGAVLSRALAQVRWADGSRGLRGTDIVVVAGKIVAKAQGKWFRLGDHQGGFQSRAGIPAGLDLDPVEDGDAAAAGLRRGLAARFGGRPGVVITSHGEVTGIAGFESGTDTAQRLLTHLIAAHEQAIAEDATYAVSIIRGLNGVLMWEDMP
ncbi:coenzyme F420-0:L-glutamate ligase/coenzyme F420-1:gamma-L-glutamate ligase [Arcanobacterium pluranimalium]|uniref:hypothetical protein n=1 Tax=Arcanobacterium pluranimalium TaxID=108028 RepID=UPI00195C74BE|nr:hypothetical protein [Arcanobacterium pluranimalium]MBM7825697.1 coenzyme F420-0:L-glutamate ligase/coenzyme F420-1:gamma-L-glutamate ligase [Arcanobacterium pluranimalium]